MAHAWMPVAEGWPGGIVEKVWVIEPFICHLQNILISNKLLALFKLVMYPCASFLNFYLAQHHSATAYKLLQHHQ